MRLTLAERSIYRDLLDHCWEEGSLPTDERMLGGIAGATPAEFKKAWPAIQVKFQERDGRLFNQKVDEKRPEVLRWHAQKSAAGRASVEAKRQRKVNGRSTVVETDVATKPGTAFQPSASSSVVEPLLPFRTADWESSEECQPDYWVPKLREAHPKGSKPRLVEQFCVDASHRLESPYEFRDFMQKVYKSLLLWVNYWKSDNPKFAPNLLDWLDCETWTKDPPVAPDSNADIPDYVPKAPRNEPEGPDEPYTLAAFGVKP